MTTWPSYSSLTVPRWPGERLLERPGRLAAVLLVLLEVDGDPRARVVLGVPRPEALEVGGGARHAPRDGELDGALDRRLAGLVGTADDGHTGGEVDVELAIAAEVADLEPADPHRRDLVAGEQQPAESQGVAELGRLVAGRRSRIGAGRGFELGDARLEVADERAGDGVGRRQGALGQGRHADVADTDLEERRGERRLDLVDVEVEVVRADADDADVEDEVRIAGLGEARR